MNEPGKMIRTNEAGKMGRMNEPGKMIRTNKAGKMGRTNMVGKRIRMSQAGKMGRISNAGKTARIIGSGFVWLLAAILCLSTLVCTAAPVSAASYLDEIQVYNITVDMRADGTMDIVYHFEWKVLDDRSEGPLEWVKIGIPNETCDSITALSDNIRSIDYYYDGGDYVRIDFDRSYYKDEIISFDFSIHQIRMYTLDYEQNRCTYDFTPGWFDDIEVKSYLLRWNSNEVIDSNADGLVLTDSDPYGSDSLISETSSSDPADSAVSAAFDPSVPAAGYFTWNGSLHPGERVNAYVEYSMTTFATSIEMQYEKNEYISWEGQIDESQPDAPFALIPIFLFGIITILSIFANFKNGKYRGGFGSHFIGRGGGGGGVGGCACASSCACACACACAGGGRAGCSAKNFYGASVRSELLKDHQAKLI